MMTTPSKTRLGKRSPQGVLVSAPSHSTDNLEQKMEGAEGGGAPTTGVGSQSSGEVMLSLDQSTGVCKGGAARQLLETPLCSVSQPDQQELHIEFPSTMLQSLLGSTSTDAPRRIVEMDEAAAAMALVSLSCEPVIIIPAQKDSVAASCETEGGCWSLGHDVHPSMDVTDKRMTPPSDRGLFMDQDSMAYDNLPPRKQKMSPASPGQHSERAAYREHSLVDLSPCLGGVNDHFRREQDFNSTEICPWSDPFVPSVASNIAQRSTCTRSATPAMQDVPEQGFQPSQPIALSQLAPAATLFDICTNPPHQAYSSVEEAAPSSSPSSNRCGTSISSVRNRKVCQPYSQGFGDHQYFRQQPPPGATSRPRSKSSRCGHSSSRKPRGNVRKCRKVYGMNQRERWCTPCRWKKACQCFPDCSDEQDDQT